MEASVTGGRRDNHDPHPDDVQEAWWAEFGGDPGLCPLGAAPRVDNALIKARARTVASPHL